jgi:hypothetical protein
VNGFVAKNPHLHVDIKRIIAEGDLVVTHVHITTSETDRGLAAIDIFRSRRKDRRALGRRAAGARQGRQRKRNVLIAPLSHKRRSPATEKPSRGFLVLVVEGD